MTKRCENELIIIVKEIVADLMESIKLKKKQKLRNNEYYNLQNIFDKLYEDSKNNKKFKNLYDIITCESNIMLAFRNIKKNKGSGTVGTDNININKYKDMSQEEFLSFCFFFNFMLSIKSATISLTIIINSFSHLLVISEP